MDDCDIKMALNGTLLEKDKVECRPDRITNAIIDDSVDVHQIRCYLTNDAWMIVQDVIERKRVCTCVHAKLVTTTCMKSSQSPVNHALNGTISTVWVW